jgi:hypothetical protein
MLVLLVLDSTINWEMLGSTALEALKGKEKYSVFGKRFLQNISQRHCTYKKGFTLAEQLHVELCRN